MPYGVVALPGGSYLEGRITDVTDSGRVKGKARVDIAFDQIFVRSKPYDIDTTNLTFEADDSHKKDAAIVAGSAVAGALRAKRMLLLTDVAGVLDANKELVRQMTVSEARAAIETGVATGGMIPKLETAIAAVEAGVEAVVILDGRRPHAMLVELFTEHGAGTLIRKG